MRRRIFLLMTAVLSVMCVYAQNDVGGFSIQPKVGVNFADATNLSDSDARVGFVGGVELEYQISDMFSVAGGVLYSMQGAKDAMLGVDENNILNDVSETLELDYINIPIVANVYLVDGLAVKLGIQPGFNVRSKYKVSVSSASASETIETKNFDFSIPIGVSYEFSNIVVDARYNWGLIGIQEDSDVRNSVFQITLGYKFEL